MDDNLLYLTNEEEKQIIKLREQAREAEEYLRDMLKPSGLIDRSAVDYKLRVKGFARIKEKWIDGRAKSRAEQRNDPNVKLYDLKNMGDILGLRLITDFPSDISKTFKEILDIISGDSTLDPNPFVRNSISEIIVYKSSTRGLAEEFENHLNQIAKDVLGNSFEIDFSAKPDMYSGIHILASARVSKNKKNQQTVPIEIQVRTLFEDLWSNVSHKLYELSRKREIVTGDETPRMNQNMVVLKNVFDSISGYADLLHQDVTGHIKKVTSIEKNLPQSSSNVARAQKYVQKSLDRVADVEGICKKHKVNSEFLNPLLKILSLRVETDKQLKENKISEKEAGLSYARIAEQYSDLRSEASIKGYVETQYPQDMGAKVFLYYVKAEEALARLSYGIPNQLAHAKRIYHALLHSFPQAAPLKFRLGQVFALSEKWDEAIIYYSDSMKLLSQFEKNQKVRKNSITHRQLNWNILLTIKPAY